MCRKRLLLFNCSHEMALAADVKQYFPPKNIQQMEDNLCLLPLWWAEEGDAIMVNDVEEARRFTKKWRGMLPNVVFTTWTEGYASLSQRTDTEYVPHPWGWNRAVKERFSRYGVSADLLPADAELANLRRFASREFVVDYFKSLGQGCADGQSALARKCVIGESPVFARSLDFEYPAGSSDNLIFKSPWSSSGRGVFASEVPLPASSRKRLEGFLNTQGGFLVDRFYDKILDFAFEYFVEANGQVRFLGFSVFLTAEGGRYGGNVLASQSELRAIIEHAAGFSMDFLIEMHRHNLERALGGKYTGIAGVDMLVVNSEGGPMVHPCIEINLRMNMGVLAMKVFEHLSGSSDGLAYGCAEKETALTPERECGFMAKCVDSRLVLGRFSK